MAKVKTVKMKWVNLAVQSLLSLTLVQAQEIWTPIPIDPPKEEAGRKVTLVPGFSTTDLDHAIEFALQKALNKDLFEKNLIVNDGILKGDTASSRHQRNTNLTPKSKQIEREQCIFEQASAFLKKLYNISNSDATNGFPSIDLERSPLAKSVIEECQSEFQTNCVDSEYRTADGSCNNLIHQTWGKSFTCFGRLLLPQYADGLSKPRISVTGGELPNARVISQKVHKAIDVPSVTYTHMTMQWGQFLDHDLTITPTTRAGPNMSLIDCCQKSGALHPECFAIPIPEDDEFYSQYNVTCLRFVRSASCSANCKLGPRQQINQLTGFIDGSNIYGSTENGTAALRSFIDGKLKSRIFPTGELLPPSPNPQNDQCSTQNAVCFQAGDVRANVQPGLTALHTLWLRQHNRLAKKFREFFPLATDEVIFQKTRKIVAAQLQAITYGEFLPAVLGPLYMYHYKLYLSYLGYTQYNPEVDPSIVSEFSTSAYRFGHSLIRDSFSQGNNSQPEMELKENFFSPAGIYNGQVEMILHGLFKQNAQSFDRHISESVTNHLYKRAGALFGLDLPALNIQRGRDHGIPGYTTYLKHFFNINIVSWSNLLIFMKLENVQKLASVYSTPHDVDLFTGGVSEYHLPFGIVGPTFGAIIGTQFQRLMLGDRYYFEHGNQIGSFTPGQRFELQRTSLANIICLNTDQKISWIQSNVFQPYLTSIKHHCDYAKDIDYRYWL